MFRFQPALRAASLLLTLCASLALTRPASAETAYVVQTGDTLTRIAVRFGVTVEALVRANRLANANTIVVGQTLVIPDGVRPADAASTIIVQPGDSLARIAARLGVSVEALIAANALSTTTLQPGQILVAPAAAAPTPLAQRIRGDAVFTRRILAALDWLQANDPEAFTQVETYVAIITPSPYRDLAQARATGGGCLVRALARRDMSPPMVAAMLVHEAIHCRQFAAGADWTVKLAEVEAYSEQLAFMYRHGFPAEALAYYERVLAYYQGQPDDGRPVPPPDF